MKKYLKLLAAIIICQLAGIVGSIFTFDSLTTWYATLNKPFFQPPNWLFGPVWIILYTLMGISLYWILNKKKNKKALKIFSVQLILNAVWSIIFFGMKNTLFAFFEIILLWIFILWMIMEFYKLDKKSAYILVPYLVWVSIAAILNLSVYLLN